MKTPTFSIALILALVLTTMLTGCQAIRPPSATTPQILPALEEQPRPLTEPLSYRNLFKSVNPSVVTLLALQRSKITPENLQGGISRSLGTGVLISTDGIIMTAAHVVDIADRVFVKLHDGRNFEADIKSAASIADVALLRLKDAPDDLVPAALGDSEVSQIGDRIIVIGAPFGIRHTLSVGYISGKHKSNEMAGGLTPIEFIQTDAAMNRGNSGGPIFNAKGEVIAIASRIISETGGFVGLSIGVSINTARALLLDRKAVWTGIEFFFLDRELARAFNLPQPGGLLIQRVAFQSLGHKLGLKSGEIPANIKGTDVLIGGDIILSINGIEVTEDEQTRIKIRQAMNQVAEQRQLDVVIYREGEVKTLRFIEPERE